MGAWHEKVRDLTRVKERLQREERIRQIDPYLTTEKKAGPNRQLEQNKPFTEVYGTESGRVSAHEPIVIEVPKEQEITQEQLDDPNWRRLNLGHLYGSDAMEKQLLDLSEFPRELNFDEREYLKATYTGLDLGLVEENGGELFRNRRGDCYVLVPILPANSNAIHWGMQFAQLAASMTYITDYHEIIRPTIWAVSDAIYVRLDSDHPQASIFSPFDDRKEAL